MSTAHEMLYTQNITENIDANAYLHTLLQKLQQSYKTQDITIKMTIDTTLNMDTSIYVGIILNELLTNALKYAFKENKGEILISLLKQTNGYLLNVSDNGAGFNPQEKSNTFGVELIKTLVEDELHGTINIHSSDKGTQYAIVWH
jgi:two-component sensor histidine kinase